MSARFWTDERRAELRRFEDLGLPLADQAARLGCTEMAVMTARSRFGLSNQSRSNARSKRRRVVKPETREKLRRAGLAAWADPASSTRAAFAKGVDEMRSGVGIERRRGFAVPAGLRAEYDRLVYGTGLSSTEAASVLGFLPAGMAVAPRAERKACLAPWRLARIRTPQGLIAAVARYHGVTVDDLASDRRGRAVTAARWQAIALLAERFPGLSAAATGRLLGLDHTSVLYARRHGPALASPQPNLSEAS